MNHKQILSIILVVLGVLLASTTQLNELLGPTATKSVQATAALLMSLLAGIQGVISGQSSLVKDVQAMDGVEKVVVNAQANPTLAGLAVDPAQLKIEIKPGAEAAVTSIANNA